MIHQNIDSNELDKAVYVKHIGEIDYIDVEESQINFSILNQVIVGTSG